MRWFFIASALYTAFFATTGAAAQTASQTDFMKQVAFLTYSEERCPKYRANWVKLVQQASSLGIGPSDWEVTGRFRRAMYDAIASIRQEFGSKETSFVCEFAEDSFGPKGAILEDALKLR